MRQVAVVSGKGGTGKTSVVASLAQLAAPVVSVDCDVDAANLALLMPGDDDLGAPVQAGQVASVDPALCVACGACVPACRFGAMQIAEQGAEIDRVRCEGCSTCSLVCPVGAISLAPRVAGHCWVRPTASGPLVHAELGVAQDSSGQLVSHVRTLAQHVAKRAGLSLLLLDGPPGIGCPVHATLAGVDAVLVVTEPTPSAEHDFARLMALLAHFPSDVAVVINKVDLVPRRGDELERMCERLGAPVLASVPFDPRIPQLLSEGRLPLQAGGETLKALTKVCDWVVSPSEERNHALCAQA